jgi:RNA polymerase sigma-70 factor (ECF subfamily)
MVDMAPPLREDLVSRPGERRGNDELMVRSGQGDVHAFGELLERHQPAVHRYCWRIFRNHHTAEDLTQEFFVKLFRNAARYEAEGHFVTYMYRVLTNLCFDALRRRKRRHKTEWAHLDPVGAEGTELEPLAPASDLDAGLVEAEAKVAVHGAMTELPVQVRKCVELREFEGLRYREIARVLDLSLNEVKVLLHRGRKLLARRLSKTAVGRSFGLLTGERSGPAAGGDERDAEGGAS